MIIVKPAWLGFLYLGNSKLDYALLMVIFKKLVLLYSSFSMENSKLKWSLFKKSRKL